MVDNSRPSRNRSPHRESNAGAQVILRSCVTAHLPNGDRGADATWGCQSRKLEPGPLPPQQGEQSPAAVLLRVRNGVTERWVIIVNPGTRAHRNGAELTLGMSVLENRDEIVLRRGATSFRYCFSTEKHPAVQAAPDALGGTCPRCKQVIEPGSPAVQCTQCGAWHHQVHGRNCWTYAPYCAACHQQTTTDNFA